jgi:hypothetical protein
MESSTIIVVGVVLALLTTLSIILLKISSKEYPAKEEEDVYVRPKFQPRKVTDLSTSEAPKKKKKRYYNKKKPTIANDAQVEKKSVGRPRKSN